MSQIPLRLGCKQPCFSVHHYKIGSLAVLGLALVEGARFYPLLIGVGSGK